MILIEKTQIMGLEPTIRGMRNPMNSWAKSDSDYRLVLSKKCDECGKYELPEEDSCDGCEISKNIEMFNHDYAVGPNDLDLMLRLAKAGSVDGKFRRMIAVYVDITAPLYWWKEFDTYKVGTVGNSCSTMHKIHAKEFTLDDFSHEHLEGALHYEDDPENVYASYGTPFWLLQATIENLNGWREIFNNGGIHLWKGEERKFKPNDKDVWWQMIQLLPSSYNQKRTIMLNYEVLSNIYQHRRNHKLDEWRELCRWIESLPYSEIITCNVPKSIFTYKEIYEKFVNTNLFVEVSDYKPYPLCDNSIIVWASKIYDMPLTPNKEIALRYIPQKDIFAPIPDAKSYDEILNGTKED